jgi:hypothetical protein
MNWRQHWKDIRGHVKFHLALQATGWLWRVALGGIVMGAVGYLRHIWNQPMPWQVSVAIFFASLILLVFALPRRRTTLHSRPLMAATPAQAAAPKPIVAGEERRSKLPMHASVSEKLADRPDPRVRLDVTAYELIGEYAKGRSKVEKEANVQRFLNKWPTLHGTCVDLEHTANGIMATIRELPGAAGIYAEFGHEWIPELEALIVPKPISVTGRLRSVDSYGVRLDRCDRA